MYKKELLIKEIIDNSLSLHIDNEFKAKLFFRDFIVKEDDKNLYLFINDIRIKISKSNNDYEARSKIIETIYKHRIDFDELRWIENVKNF